MGLAIPGTIGGRLFLDCLLLHKERPCTGSTMLKPARLGFGALHSSMFDNCVILVGDVALGNQISTPHRKSKFELSQQLRCENAHTHLNFQTLPYSMRDFHATN